MIENPTRIIGPVIVLGAIVAAMSVCMLPLFYGYTLKFLSMHLDWESIGQKQQIDPLTLFWNWFF